MRCLIFSLTVLLVSSSVFAQTQSSNTPAVVSKSLLSTFKMGFFGWGYGPSVSAFNGGVTPNPQANGSSNPSGIWTQLTPRVRLTDRFEFVVVPTFLTQPFSVNQPFVMQNPTAGITGMFYDGAEFKWWTRSEMVIPTIASSRAAGQLLSPQMINVLSYRALGSNWDFRQVVLPFLSLFADGRRTGGFYLSPMLFYHLSPSVAGVAIGEIFTGTSGALGNLSQTAPSYGGVGARYTWKSGHFVQPYLNTFPDQPSWRNTSVAILFGGPLVN